MSKSAKIALAQLSQTPSEKKMVGPEVERLLAEVTEVTEVAGGAGRNGGGRRHFL